MMYIGLYRPSPYIAHVAAGAVRGFAVNRIPFKNVNRHRATVDIS